MIEHRQQLLVTTKDDSRDVRTLDMLLGLRKAMDAAPVRYFEGVAFDTKGRDVGLKTMIDTCITLRIRSMRLKGSEDVAKSLLDFYKGSR